MVDDAVVALVEKARQVEKEEIEKLPPAYQYQFTRVREDMEEN